MSEQTLTLPIPPSVNDYWKTKVIRVKGRYVSRVYVSDEARSYKENVGWILKGSLLHTLTGYVAINISVYRPAKRGDLDNYEKVLLDSLEGYLYENDRQIVEKHSFRYDDKDNPRVEIVAWEVKEW